MWFIAEAGTPSLNTTSSLDAWLGNRQVTSVGTNFGANTLPFQSWQRFKEAFTPEIVIQAVRESTIEVRSILDPFGGSGTTGLTAQFLGIEPVLVEVNPYLADVIRAKLTHYDRARLSEHVEDFLEMLPSPPTSAFGRSLPSTFVEGPDKNRWIYSAELADYLLRVIDLAQTFEADVARFLKVVVGGALIDLSNVRVNGKGRRYRGGWLANQKDPAFAAEVIKARTISARTDIARFGCRPQTDFQVVLGDARLAIPPERRFDLCVFSPPYPNSFDYTDVYNVELWMLGYINDSAQNRTLRESTLSSHVQIGRDFALPPPGSLTLARVLEQLDEARPTLWSRHLPEMVGGYFADMNGVIDAARMALNPQGSICAVVGDSQYGGVAIPVAKILEELAQSKGHQVKRERVRSMRSSPQQGGRAELPESVLTIRDF